MKLRPHHLLCVQKFTGHGYNADFTAHMSRISAELMEHPDTKITVAYGCDDLCKMCPNKIDGICTSLEKVSSMDRAVLGICDLSYGESISWEDAAGKARKRILFTEDFDNVCADCQWYELCKSTEVKYE